jgi:hypothetical protein
MNGFVVPALAQRELANRLAEAHRFDSNDLALNSEGSISRRQLLRLVGEAFHPVLRALAGAALLLACLAGVYSLLARQGNVGSIIYIALAAILFGSAASIRRLIRLCIDYSRGQVWQVTGRLNPSWEDRGQGLVNSAETGSRAKSAYRYSVAGEQFEVNDRIYRLLADHFELGYPTVTLYYTPYTRKVLSLRISGVEPTLQSKAQAARGKAERPKSIWKS